MFEKLIIGYLHVHFMDKICLGIMEGVKWTGGRGKGDEGVGEERRMGGVRRGKGREVSLISVPIGPAGRQVSAKGDRT